MFKIMMIAALLLMGQNQSERKRYFNLDDEALAIQGYDPVRYFSGAPKEGKENIKYTHQGVTYYFVSEDNRKKFIADPAQYEPQYGGWCAYAMGDSGEKVKIDPETYKIVNNKLYLFYNFFFNNTLKDWSQNETALKHKADDNWQKIIKR